MTKRTNEVNDRGSPAACGISRFSYERLSRLRRLVTHANCPDGYASAAIIKDALPKISVDYVMPGTAAHAGLEATTDTIFCDLTPPKAKIAEFKAAKTIVLDHHERQRDIVEAFGVDAEASVADGVYSSEPGVSGAMLAYRHVWLESKPSVAGQLVTDRQVKEFARLIGTRDTWQTSSPDWSDACALSAVVMLQGPQLDTPAGYLDLMGVGHSLVRRRQRDVEAAMIEALSCRIGERIVAVVNDMFLVSDIAEYIGPAVDMVVGFRYFVDNDDKLKLKLSLRTVRDDVDCGRFAEEKGGGGHRKAASYHVTMVGTGAGPYGVIEAALCSFWEEWSTVVWEHSRPHTFRVASGSNIGI